MRKFTAVLLMFIFLFSFTVFSAAQLNVLPQSAENVPSPPEISAQYALLLDLQTNTILYEKQADTQMSPASLTKIMTALLVAESGMDLNTVVTVSNTAVNVPSGSSIMGLEAGDQITLIDLLYGLMLRSGNDAACALAEAISGSVESFVELMNSRAAELGMNNTHFINPHGFADETHYTTARDMAVLCCEYIKYELLNTVAATSSYEVNLTSRDGTQKSFRVTNTNPLLTDSQYGDYVTGLKTGFTQRAGNCIIIRYQREGRDLLSLIFNSPQGYRDSDAVALADYGYTQFSTIDLARIFQNRSVVVTVQNCSTEDEHNGQLELQMSSAAPTYYTTTASVANRIVSGSDILTIETPANISAPVYAGDEIGTVTYKINGETIYSNTVTAARTVFAHINIPDDLVPIEREDNTSALAAILSNKLLWIGLAAAVAAGVAIYIFIRIRKTKARQMNRRRTTVFARERYRQNKYY